MKTEFRNFLTTVLVGAVLAVTSMPIAAVSQETDAAMQFYLDNVSYVFGRNYVFDMDGDFSFKVRSILEKINYRGEQESIDTASFGLQFRGGKLDLTETIDTAATEDNIPPNSFTFPKPWEQNYDFYFFPNDTGAGRLAIGFESRDTTGKRQLAGFFNVNRDNYYVEELFFHNPDPDNYERLSEAILFDRSGKLILITRIEIHAVTFRFFMRQYSRQVLEFYDYNVEKL